MWVPLDLKGFDGWGRGGRVGGEGSEIFDYKSQHPVRVASCAGGTRMTGPARRTWQVSVREERGQSSHYC